MPNIVLFVMDSQRVSNVSVYGYGKHTTPHLEALASDGMVCENHVSPSPWCLASYASILTGRYPSSHGANIRFECLTTEFPTLPEILQRHGYVTAGFSSNSYVSELVGLARGFEQFEFFKGDPEVEQDKGSTEMERRVLRRLDSLDPGRPFFLFINSNEPHWPYWAPEPYRCLFLPPARSETAQALHELSLRALRPPDAKERPLTPEEWQVVKALYDGETARADGALGAIVDALRARDLLDRTLVVVTSDHGDDQGEHIGYLSHSCCLYRTVLHVPLVMRLPGCVPTGIRHSGLTQSVDLLPTFLTLAGLDDEEWHEGLEGFSLVPTFSQQSARRCAIAEFAPPLQALERDLRHSPLPSRDARKQFHALKSFEDGNYRFIWSSDGDDQLYDLKSDPGEAQNLIDNLPQTAAAYYEEMDKWVMARPHRDYGDALNVHPIKGVHQENLRRLEQWGLLRRIHPLPFGSGEHLSDTLDRQ
jgi:arylsulfatase A-like enzyme